MKTNETCPFHLQDIVRGSTRLFSFLCGEETPRNFGEETPRQIEDVARKLFLTQNPECTLSLHEPGSQRESQTISSNKETLNNLSSRISIRSCVVQVLSGRFVQVHCLVRQSETLLPNIANNAREDVKAAHLHNQDTFLLLKLRMGAQNKSKTRRFHI